jgi:hypothetical protein
MKYLTFTQPHELAELHGELLAALPALRPGADGWAAMSLSGDGPSLMIGVPDDVAEGDVAAVVAAHEPTGARKRAALRALRAERNRRLAACDWTQLADAPVDKQAWADYRQQLRDLPAAAAADPANAVWPVPPGDVEPAVTR